MHPKSKPSQIPPVAQLSFPTMTRCRLFRGHLGKRIEPDHCDILSWSAKRDRGAIEYFMNLIDKNPHYQGMGHWIYLHKKSNNILFQLYILRKIEN